MRRLALFVVHRRWVVIALALLFLPFAALVGGGVAKDLTVGGLEDPSSESFRTAEEISRRFENAGQSDFVILVTAKDGDVDAEAVKSEGLAITKELTKAPGIGTASSYWSLGLFGAPLKSRDGSQALVFGSVAGGLDEKVKFAQKFSEEFTRETDAVTTSITGRSEVARQVSEAAEHDLQRSELLTAPLIFVALILVFGGVVAALLPLSVGILAVVATLVVLAILVSLTEVSVFALNLTTGLGLGLAIDYSLFVVSRYREELASGASTNVAIGRTMQTAGRTVVFSAGTVMISLSALLLFQVTYLRSFAYAGVAVVFLAALASVIVLPAILAVLGPRVESLRIFKVKPPSDDGFWGRQATRVMKHPVIYAVTVSAVLVVLAIPFFNFNAGLIDDRVVPSEVSSRATTDQIRQNFETRESGALQILLPDANLQADAAEIETFAKKLLVLPGVKRVDTGNGSYQVLDNGEISPPLVNALSTRFEPDAGSVGTWLSVVPDIEPHSAEAEDLVESIRSTAAPFSFTVAGESASLVDTKESVFSVLPWTLALIALATFILLFMMTGSLLVPLKALLLNVLSLTATFGAMVWIFQEGHFSGLLGFTPTGTIDIFTPILMFCIAFGLSMDYEVFLLSRIKEEYDLDRDNEHAVRVGLQKTGRIVTAAALLLTIVFVGIATSKVSIVQLFGVGLSLAVLVDAFLIRATLVPAFMRLAGRLNWWSPSWLRRWHLRYGIWENEPIAILDREFETTK